VAVAAALAEQAAAMSIEETKTGTAAEGDAEGDAGSDAGGVKALGGKGAGKTLSKAELAKLLLCGDDVDERGNPLTGGATLGEADGRPKDKLKRTRMQNSKGTATMYIKP